MTVPYTFRLDLPTLLFVTALVLGFSGGLMILARGPRRDASAVFVWGIAMLLGAAGLVLTGAGPDHRWLSDGVGTALLLAGSALSWTAACIFAGLPRRPIPAAAGPVLWLLSIPLHDAGPGWLALACWLGAAYTMATAAALHHGRSEKLSLRNPAITLLAIHALLYASRGAMALLGGPGPDWAQPVVAVMLIETLLHTNGMAFLLLAMKKERFERRSIEQVQALSLLDPLTRIGNRRLFDERLHEEAHRSARTGAALALLFIDVDQFKAYNDAFGHPSGDVALRAVAQTVASFVRRPGDLAARYGGEEFAVLLPGTDTAAAAAIAHSIGAAVWALGIPHRMSPGVVTISTGVAGLPHGAGPDNEPGQALLKAADTAVYAAKAAGRNTVRIAESA